jgi:hypothetical protein
VAAGPVEGHAPATRILTAELAAPVPGVHDLLLVARGEAGGTGPVLFDLTWFAFEAGPPAGSGSR